MSVALLEMAAVSPTLSARRPALASRLRARTPEIPAHRTGYVRRAGECQPRTFAVSPGETKRCGVRSEAVSHYGPNLLPLFYTAHRLAPERLEWESLAPHHASRLTFGLSGGSSEISPLFEETLCPGAHSCPLQEREWQPGVLYAWRVEMLDAPAETPVQEGRFWLLDTIQQARWKLGCRALAEEGGDRDFAAIALALFLAELELYQDALELIKQGPARAERASRVLLAHTAQALVYRQMQKNLEAARQDGIPEAAPSEAFLLWASRRERYHCDRASAHLEAAGAETQESEALTIDWQERNLLGSLRAL